MTRAVPRAANGKLGVSEGPPDSATLMDMRTIADDSPARKRFLEEWRRFPGAPAPLPAGFEGAF